MTNSARCFWARVGLVVGGRPVDSDTIWPAAFVVSPSAFRA